MVSKLTFPTTQNQVLSKVNEIIDGKQDNLVSGTNIKTVNGNSLLGAGDITISGSGYHPDLFTWQWADHELNDVQWLRGDTFSWQYGSMYQPAYQHLVDDKNDTITRFIQHVDFSGDSKTYYRSTQFDVSGASKPYAYTSYFDSDIITVYTSDSTITASSTFYTDSTGSTSAGTMSSHGSGGEKVPTVETVNGVKIAYYTADDGHKIVLANQESNVASIYNATGVAWYYIIDTTNQRFKLPRELPITDKSKGNGMTLGLTNGAINFGSYKSTSNSYPRYCLNSLYYGKSIGASVSDSTTTEGNDLVIGVTTDPTKSGIISHRANENGQQYLYFYVGNFTQTALENTAGLNTELFNGKADLNLSNTASNIDFVIERQEPTAANNYTWYRKYRSGWVEQGGQAENKTVSLPITMSDANYETIINVLYNNNGGTIYSELGYVSKTTTSFTKSGNATVFNWMVYGIAA